MAFLLTWHGTLLCRHRPSGELVHRPLLATLDDAEPVLLDLPIEQLQPSFAHHLRAAMPELPEYAPGELQQFRLRWGSDQRSVTLQHGAVFLSAEPDAGQTMLSQTEAADWENFLPVSVTDLDALRVLLASSWLVRSTGALIERPTTSQFFELRVGDLAVDLRHQLPFDLARWPFRLTLLRDGWRIDQICQYRPLVYYAAFASPDIMRQLAVSLRSLIEFGRYDGPIVLLTDHKPADLAQFVPAEHLARLALLPVQPSDPPGYMTARYLLLDWADARLFQPVLYVDTDIVFDNDVMPMLQAIALSDRIAAPVELMSTLAGQPSVGSTLLQRDLCAPGFMAGFNSGTLGIPNLHEHAAMLRLIRRLIMNHSLVYGRTALPYADQEIANYVSYRIGHFDTTLLSRFVRYAGHDAHLGSRSGLVHFWPVPGASERANAMRNYLDRLGTL